MKRVRKRRRLKWKNIIAFLIILISLLMLGISLINIFIWKKDSDDTIEQIDKINQVTNIEDVLDDENVEITNQEEEIDEFNPYWDYIKMNLINVDFQELKIINKDTIGWIRVNGTNINYPFVH